MISRHDSSCQFALVIAESAWDVMFELNGYCKTRNVVLLIRGHTSVACAGAFDNTIGNPLDLLQWPLRVDSNKNSMK
jgi:hypothetical protein